ncbi:Ecp60-1 [Fulvia fulva]|uniref:Ecp60-1 n=1 Tax=Passalora fulva TaxID=5499 RepID=A0A1P8YXS9_PASFU|nr:Ecp60-1 [Fulvia fulva]AQA29321.1 extracellular protein 60-1 [Fulvia fulva]KAK4626523.1 Ecp60-1 [Fulvia fulva]KAK4627580.1 Ecp60-1 [Fulvia fulva]UJO22710.1 Ecp60-1 [Fulvia fulva]WPV13973.1 Ecp60-1 [Fulvia fulva]
MAPLLRSLIAVSAAVSTVQAMPWGDNRSRWTISLSTTPALPLKQVDNTGSTPLPEPTGKLHYIQLGSGFQNYSCSASNTWVASVPSAGAIAQLYDVTAIVNQLTTDSYTKNTLKSFETCLKATKCTPDVNNGYCDQCHRISAAAFQAWNDGEHYFDQLNGAQTPNFAVADDFISGKKVGAVKAPKAAYKGESDLGAVDWLYLVDNGSGRTHGLKSVYRIHTAGGVAPSSCSKPGSALQVPYAAEYWFYN